MSDEEARAAKLAELNEEMRSLFSKYEHVAVVAVLIGAESEKTEGGGFRITERFMFANHSEAAHLFTPPVMAAILEQQREIPMQKGLFN